MVCNLLMMVLFIIRLLSSVYELAPKVIMPISLMFRLQRLPILRNQFLDRELQEEYIKNSTLDWIIIRPGGLTDGPLTGQYLHGFSINDTTVKIKISRADVADFMLKQIYGDTYLHKTPSLSY